MGTSPVEFVVDKAGNKKRVILSLSRYRRLLEDLHDLAVVAERRREQPTSIEDMKKRLRAHGVL